MSTPWLYWGLGPTLAATLGFVAVSVFCEWAIRQPWAQSAFIVYTEDGDRLKDLADTRSKIAWEAQVAACASHRRVRQRRRSLWIVSGPINIVGVSVIRYVFPLIVGPPRSLLPPLWQFALHFVLLALIADLGLYWGHRLVALCMRAVLCSQLRRQGSSTVRAHSVPSTATLTAHPQSPRFCGKGSTRCTIA